MKRLTTHTLCLLITFSAVALAGPMEEEKLYTLPTQQTTLHPRMAELLGWAIAQPDELTVLSGLADVAKLKVTDLSPKVSSLLQDTRLLVSTTAIQTLSALDAKTAAEPLLPFVRAVEWATHEQREQTASADELLARWADARGVPAWAARLANRDTPLPLRASAARALASGVDGNDKAREALLNVATSDKEPMPLRLDAADSLGIVQPEGLLAVSEKLIASGLNGKLIAARLLRHHSDAAALTTLTKLANDPQPAVQTPAMRRLLEVEPSRLWPTAESLAASTDPVVRHLIVLACKAWHDRQAVNLCAAAMDDAHPTVRNEARAMLFILAKQESLDGAVRDSLRRWLNQAVSERPENPAPHWRAAEQSALLAGQLDDKPANPALILIVSELEHPRLEVRLAAVGSIRTLHLPQSRKPMVDLLTRLIDRIEKRAADFKSKKDAAPEKDAAAAEKIAPPDQLPDSRYLAETAQTMGAWNVQETDKTLRRLIPKHHPAYPIARASAIWSLGMLYTDNPDHTLAKLFEDRLYDLNPLDPEAHEVRLQSAIAIGRMRALFEKEALEIRYEQDGLEIKAACRWALIHMTGEPLPEITLEPGQLSDAFIQPLD